MVELLSSSSDERISELKDAFAIFDKDGDGMITAIELGTTMRALGGDPTDEELCDMISNFDVNGDGVIDFAEFCTMMEGNLAEVENNDEELQEAFKAFGADDGGQISPAELKLRMEKLGIQLSDSELEEIVREANINGETDVDHSEFAMMAHLKWFSTH